jgi:hypothetical protein
VPTRAAAAAIRATKFVLTPDLPVEPAAVFACATDDPREALADLEFEASP